MNRVIIILCLFFPAFAFCGENQLKDPRNSEHLKYMYPIKYFDDECSYEDLVNYAGMCLRAYELDLFRWYCEDAKRYYCYKPNLSLEERVDEFHSDIVGVFHNEYRSISFKIIETLYIAGAIPYKHEYNQIADVISKYDFLHTKHDQIYDVMNCYEFYCKKIPYSFNDPTDVNPEEEFCEIPRLTINKTWEDLPVKREFTVLHTQLYVGVMMCSVFSEKNYSCEFGIKMIESALYELLFNFKNYKDNEMDDEYYDYLCEFFKYIVYHKLYPWDTWDS